MSRTIKVLLGEEAASIGVLRFEAQRGRQSASFEYDSTWLSAEERFEIDPTLPLLTGPQFRKRSKAGSVFAPAVADTEPDGWSRRVILRDHAKRRRAGEPVGASLTELDFLLAVDDDSRVGALRFQDEQGSIQRAPEDGRRRAPPFVELGRLLAATRAVETDTESAADLEYLRGRGTSLGGMRPKCTVIDPVGRLAIGKFPSVADERLVTHGEVLAMQLAARAGIDAAKAQLVDSEGIPVALVRRFDRAEDGKRVMYVSAATLLGADIDAAQEHSYTEIVDALRVHGAAPRADAEELWRRMAFSILVTNVDDHLHNHGFLHTRKGMWRLSPAFDLNPFPDRARELKTWISEETGPEASIDALMTCIPYFRIELPRAKEILAEVEASVGSWRAGGRALGMSDRDLDRFADAFEHDERAVARRTSQRK